MPRWKQIVFKITGYIMLIALIIWGYIASVKKGKEYQRLEETTTETEVVLIRKEGDFDIYMVVFRGDTSVVATKK